MHASGLGSMRAFAALARPLAVDFVEAGAGPLVVLVHSSTSGARQWSGLIRDLQDRFHVRAVNLFGYGGSPCWHRRQAPSLDDFAELVARAGPDGAREVCLVGHSFGGAVAMQATAVQLRARVRRLVLFEPSLFYLLHCCGHYDAFNEIAAVADETRRRIAAADTGGATESFIDYWCGAGAWAANSPERKSALMRAIARVPHEFTAVLTGQTTPAGWAAALPRCTLLMTSVTTTRPSREIIQILSSACPDWKLVRLSQGCHMAPVTHAPIVNPIVADFLAAAGPSARSACEPVSPPAADQIRSSASSTGPPARPTTSRPWPPSSAPTSS
jgi:pimeloyl-ACP methyl ester carboxylesterase